jgi:hypothetical protein
MTPNDSFSMRRRKSLEDRSLEFDKLRLLQMRDAKENLTLKNRLQELKEANEVERKQLESQVSTVIHSQAGHIAAQRQKISMLQSALQEELSLSQNRIAEQVDLAQSTLLKYNRDM